MRPFIKVSAIWLIVGSIPLLAQNQGWVKLATLATPLQAVEFVDSLHGWTASGSNAIYRTINGGTTWTAYSSNAPFMVESISFSDTLNGWCAGTDGTTGDIIHTTDGGKTWTWQLEKYPRQYLSTHALSKDRNITCGQTKNISGPDTGKIVMTTDAGKTWIEMSPVDSDVVFKKMQFLDSLNGYILCANLLYQNQANLRTRDGGRTWIQLPPRAQIQVMTFLDTLRGWGGYQDVTFHTTDGGMSWQYQANLDQPDQLSMEYIQFVDSLKGWAFGYMFFQGIISEGIFRTTDGGNNWFMESIGLTDDFDDITDAHMFNDHSGIAVCARGSVLRYQVVTSVVSNPSKAPTGFALRQNYPNPFNPTTTIEYSIPSNAFVTLNIFNLLGNTVATLVNQKQNSGSHSVNFNGTFLASGVYFYRLQAAGFHAAKKFVLLK